MKIINRIRELRKDNKISQSELANMLNVSRNTISSLETSEYYPSLPLAFKIAKYFDKKIEDIFIFMEGEDDGKY